MTASTGPILFLNPAILIEPLAPTWIGGEPVYGLRSVPPQLNGSAERLNEICREVGAGIVLTRITAMGDARARLTAIGFRAAYHADWITDPALGPGVGISAWLLAHGCPRHAIIGRPGEATVDSPSVDVPIGQEFPASGVPALIAALA